MFWDLPYWPRTYIQTVCVSFVIAALGMPVVLYALGRAGVVDAVAHNKIHDRPIVRGGGIMIFIAFAVAVLLPNYRENPMKGVMLGAFICLAVGAIDDIRGGIPAAWKFVTLVAVTIIMSRYGVDLHVFKFYPLDLALTILWMVGCTSAFNGLDNMDGLAGGVAAIASGIYLIIAVQAFWVAGTETSLSWFGLMAAGLLGANLGFLIYNFRPACLFMGDAGSFFLGFTLAALGVMGEYTPNRLISCTIPVLILGVPIFDFVYILVARIVRGDTRTVREVLEHCATDHLSHRLVWIGFSQRQAVLIIYLLTLTLGVSGILLRNSTGLLDSVLGLLQSLSIFAIVVVLMAAAAKAHQKAEKDRAGK